MRMLFRLTKEFDFPQFKGWACALALAAATLTQAREVSWAPARFEGDLELEKQTFRFAYFPTANRIRVLHGNGNGEAKSGVFTIRNAKGETLFTRTVADEREWAASVPDLAETTRRTGDGAYAAVFAERGGPTQTIAFRRDVFDWEGKGFGRSDTVPPPFEPVDASDTTVRTVLRTHELDSVGLVKSLVAADREILAGPIQLLVEKDGRTEAVTGSGFRFTARAQSQASGAATIDGPSLKGRLDGTWWCDGMFDCRLTLTSGAVDGLRLRIPVRKEIATHFHAVKDTTRHNAAGRLPDGQGVVWDGTRIDSGAFAGDYVPYLWIGGALRGISVFGDNDRGWTTGRRPCQEICRNTDGSVDICLNLIQSPVVIDRPRTIRFALQATPVKPMEEGWRAIGGEHLLGGCWYWGAQTPCNDLEPYDGTDRFFEAMAKARRTGAADEAFVEDFMRGYRCSDGVDPESASNRVKHVRQYLQIALREAAGAKDGAYSLVFYTNGRGIRLGTPPGTTFCDEWHLYRNVNRAAFDVDASGAYDLDPVPSFLDYASTCWRRMVGSGACDSLYFDDVFLAANRNPETSDAFVAEDGRLHPASGIFNMREQVRRAAVTMAELGKPCRRNWIHMSRTAMAPVSAFAGLHYDIEDNYAKLPFQERYSRDYLIAETIGRQFGVRTRVMCYFDGAHPEHADGLIDGTLGVLLTHEIEWRRMGRWNEMRRRLVDWGYARPTTRVWNYWEGADYPLAVSGLKTSSLALRRADGEALVVVSSWEHNGGVARLKPASALFDGPFQATDWLTGEALSVEDGSVVLPIAGYRWRAVRLTAADRTAPADLVTCSWPMTIPWATEVEVTPLDGGKPFLTFVKGGRLVLTGPRGARYRCRWNDLNGVPGGIDVEIPYRQ